MIRLAILAILASMISCAHGGSFDVCKHDFSFKDSRFDLDQSGTVTVADFGLYRQRCIKGK